MRPRPLFPLLRLLSVLTAAALLGPVRSSADAAPFFLGLGDLPGGDVYSLALGVSADGSVIVGDGDPDGSIDRAPFRWTATTGVTALVDSLGASRGQAYAVSNDGETVFGVWSTAKNQAFRWTASEGVFGLGWLPSDPLDSFAFGSSGDGTVACGVSNSGESGGVEPIVRRETGGLMGLGDLPGGIFYAIAWDVSADGATVVGSARASLSANEPFLWSEKNGFVFPDTTRGIEFPGEFFAVSANGDVAAGYTSSGPIIWNADDGIRLVADVLVNDLGLSLTGWTLGTATGISTDGMTIVGSGINPQGKFEGWVAGLGSNVTAAASASTQPQRSPGIELVLLGPNPFTATTSFEIRSDAGAGPFRADVLRVDGRRVRRLASDVPSGSTRVLQWDGRDDHTKRSAPGVYWLAVTGPGVRVARQVVLGP